MTKRTTFVLSALFVALLSLVLITGSAFAQETTPGAEETPAPNRLQQMQERMGAEGWAEMIQHMTETRGAEFTGQMLQRMATDEGCPMDGEGFGPMHGDGQGFGSMHGDGEGYGSMHRGGEGYGSMHRGGQGFGSMHGGTAQNQSGVWGMMGRMFRR